MGYSVLYVAFGIVALWLLGEVLLQYKARLRWRVLAFAGFLCVVGGVYLREVAVILAGAVAFGTGQTFVTLSYKRGFSTGWALGGRPGSSRRRKGATPRPAQPVLEVGPIEAPAASGPATAAHAPAAQDVLSGEPSGAQNQYTQVYQPVPMLDDSGEYPLYDGQSTYTPDPYTSGGYEGYGAQGYAGWGAEPQPAAAMGTPPGGRAEGGYETAGTYQNTEYGYGSYGYDQSGQGAAYQGAYQGYEQQPAAASWDGGGSDGSGSSYGYSGYDPYAPQPGAGGGEWAQPHPQHPDFGTSGPHAPADLYAGYGHDGHNPPQQPYIPPQPQQPPYEQQDRQPADPYDPYRY